MTMLEFINYSVSLNNSNAPLIKDISFKLEKAQSLGIVGESGSGKSLTALSALGLLNRRIFSIKGQVLVNLLLKTILYGGSLGSGVDEERSKLRVGM